MERKKEKIMLLSLQRRQQQEEAKARKEIESMQRREKEREKEDERARKREEQAARRALILEQHKYKKAVEEAEQKGITLDRNDFALIKQQMSSPAAPPKMRQPKAVSRPRPKTICVERGSIDQSEASSLSSRDKKGSSTNLTGTLCGDRVAQLVFVIKRKRIFFGLLHDPRLTIFSSFFFSYTKCNSLITHSLITHLFCVVFCFLFILFFTLISHRLRKTIKLKFDKTRLL